MAFQQVFISHCVKSCAARARQLNDLLQQSTISTFICLEMEPGADFRRMINGNAANCKLMVVFLDRSWEESKECTSEFNIALARHNKTNSPAIVAIMVQGFDWIDATQHTTTVGITANFQCVPLQKDDDEHWAKVFEQILDISLKYVSREIDSQDNLDRFLIGFTTCQLCNKQMRLPKILPCTHTFGSRCLEQYRKAQGSEEDFKCPKCCAVCSIQIKDLPDDLKVKQLISIVESDSNSNTRDSSELEEDLESFESLDIPDFRRSQPNLVSASVLSSSQIELHNDDLHEWFQKYNIPEEVQEVLAKDGYEFLDIVLKLSIRQIKSFGFKPGHEQKFIFSIRQTRERKKTRKKFSLFLPVSKIGNATISYAGSFCRKQGDKSAQKTPASALKSYSCAPSSLQAEPPSSNNVPSTSEPRSYFFYVPNFLRPITQSASQEALSFKIEKCFDERSLENGFVANDTLKLWRTFGPDQMETIFVKLDKEAERISADSNIPIVEKAEKLFQIAMVLSDSGLYERAEAWSSEVRVLAKKQRLPEDLYSKSKLQLALILQQKLQFQCGFSESELGDCRRMLAHATVVIGRGKKHNVSKAMLCKAAILEMFAMQALGSSQPEYLKGMEKQVKATASEVSGLLPVLNNASLSAEFALTEALVDKAMPSKRSLQQQLEGVIRKLQKARTNLFRECGEFNTLMMRIYRHLADIFEREDLKMYNYAYDCHRRAWFISRTIFGPRHRVTRLANAVLQQERYRKIGSQKGYSSPDENNACSKDWSARVMDALKHSIKLGL